MLIEEPVDRPTFKIFMAEQLLSLLKQGSLVIMDNLSVHKDIFDIRKFSQKGIRIKYLLPYSPDLNPIENMWSKIKSIVCKLKPCNFEEIWNAVNRGIWAVTSADLPGWFKHCG